MKKELDINLNKFINSCDDKEIDYRCNLSFTLLNFLLNSSNDIQCTIDLSGCIDDSYVFNEIFNFFDIRFPRRIKITNF